MTLSVMRAMPGRNANWAALVCGVEVAAAANEELEVLGATEDGGTELVLVLAVTTDGAIEAAAAWTIRIGVFRGEAPQGFTHRY